MKTAEIISNPRNPRWISEEQLKKLCSSISEFEQMMEARPIVVDEQNVILGGNMRHRALIELGYTEIPDKWVKKVNGLTEQEKDEFVLKDNTHFGEWDMDKLKEFGSKEKLESYGLDIYLDDFTESLLETGDEEEEGTKKVKLKTIQIEFSSEKYEAARDNFAKLKGAGVDVGEAMLNHFKAKLPTDVQD